MFLIPVGGVIAVFIRQPDGETLAQLADSGMSVTINIRVRNSTTTMIGPGQSGHHSGDLGGLGHGLGDAAANSGPIVTVLCA